MKKIFLKTTILICFFISFIPAKAQWGKIQGIVKDTTAFPRVENATAMLITASDFMLQKFTRTHKDGSFVLDKIPYGRYVLVISHPDFGDYVEEVVFADSLKSI